MREGSIFSHNRRMELHTRAFFDILWGSQASTVAFGTSVVASINALDGSRNLGLKCQTNLLVENYHRCIFLIHDKHSQTSE